MPVPEHLQKQIAEAEEEAITSKVNSIFNNYAPKELALSGIDGAVLVALEYVNGKLARIGSARNCQDVFSLLNLATSTMEAFDEDHTMDENGDKVEDSGIESSEDTDIDITDDGGKVAERRRGPSIGFTVKFADGKVIKHTTARRTMIEALRYMGLERASKYRGEMFMGYPLIGKEKRPAEPGRTWQKNVDGWWIYVNMGNSRAISCLNGIAKMLGIDMEIIMDCETSESESESLLPLTFDSIKPKNKRATFSVNGSMPLAKNRSVYESVCQFIRQFPEASFAEIAEMFPNALQGSYGVVRTIDDINQRSEKNKTESSRWFLEPEEILTSADGVRFAVSTEWGDNFSAFQKHVSKSFGWTIEEV